MGINPYREDSTGMKERDSLRGVNPRAAAQALRRRRKTAVAQVRNFSGKRLQKFFTSRKGTAIGIVPTPVI